MCPLAMFVHLSPSKTTIDCSLILKLLYMYVVVSWLLVVYLCVFVFIRVIALQAVCHVLPLGLVCVCKQQPSLCQYELLRSGPTVRTALVNSEQKICQHPHWWIHNLSH